MSQLRLHQEIGGYQFEGPYLGLKRIPNGKGIYAIVSHDGKKYYLLDIAYSEDIKKDCKNNSRKECWEHFKKGNIHFAFLQGKQMDKATYKSIVKEIREKYEKIPCG